MPCIPLSLVRWDLESCLGLGFSSGKNEGHYNSQYPKIAVGLLFLFCAEGEASNVPDSASESLGIERLRGPQREPCTSYFLLCLFVSFFLSFW
jgi:hypothetical protein